MPKRPMICLFCVNEQDVTELRTKAKAVGYDIVHNISFPNDEPPYIQTNRWGHGVSYTKAYIEDGESLSYYLVLSKQARKLIQTLNEEREDYEGYYLEGIMTRNAGEHNHTPREYALHGIEFNQSLNRPPRIKYFGELPKSLCN